ncbi:MAG TPA: dipeptidase [Caulobacteraceae bacterium]|nr:dipeptidase [Caulobacteraceae bacterium]
MPLHRICLAAALLALAGAAAAAPAPLPAGVSAEAMAIHQSMLVLDSHLDIPASFGRPGYDIMDRHDVKADGSQVDYPRMVDGGLDGGFFAVFTGALARTPEGRAQSRDAALVRATEIHEMVARNHDRFELATRPEDAARIAGAGKRVVFMSIENSQPLATDLTLMTTFYRLGVRLMGPIHFLNNELGDSSTDPAGPEWHGLSPLGKQFVAEANRLGVLLDASHSSDEVLDQMIALSKTPILLSHSGLKAIHDHPRNIDDDRLRALARSGGVIQVNAFSAYMIDIPKVPERDAAVAALNRKYGPNAARTEAARAAFRTEMAAVEAKWPTPRATFEDLKKHLDHALQVAGVDHVGVGADFDGGGGLVGFEDARDYPKITAYLLSKGYSQADIQKIWSGNVLRILALAQAGRTAPVERADNTLVQSLQVHGE